MKIIIIGNGIIALSTAYKIAKRASSADELYIIGNNKRTGSATLAAPAMLNSYCEIGCNTLSSKIDLFRFELSRKATDSWPDLFWGEQLPLTGTTWSQRRGVVKKALSLPGDNSINPISSGAEVPNVVPSTAVMIRSWVPLVVKRTVQSRPTVGYDCSFKMVIWPYCWARNSWAEPNWSNVRCCW